MPPVRAIGLLVCSLMMGSCASAPDLPPEEEISIADVFYAVQCELKPAIADLSSYYPTLPSWSVTVGVTLLAFDKSTFSPGVSIGIPIARTMDVLKGFVLPGAGSSLDGENTQVMSAKAGFILRDILRVKCDRISALDRHHLTSELGISTILSRSLRAIADPEGYAAPATITSKIEFVVTKGFNASVNASIFRFNGPDTGRIVPAATMSASRKNDNTLELVFNPPPPLVPAPLTASVAR